MTKFGVREWHMNVAWDTGGEGREKKIEAKSLKLE